MRRILLLALILFAPAVAHAEPPPGMAPADRLARARLWLKAHPDDGDTWRFAGQQMLAAERLDEAADALERAAALGKGDPATHATVLIRLGRMGDARAVVDEAVTKQPDRRRAVLDLTAQALAAAGEIGRARMVLDAALARTPSDVGLLTKRAEIEPPLGAIPHLERAVSLRPRDAALRRALIRAWFDAGQPARARSAFDDARAAGIAPDDGLAALGVTVLAAAGEPGQAVAFGEGYLKTRPKAVAVLRALAPALAAAGAPAKAGEALVRAFRQGPPDPASLALAQVLVPAGERAAVFADLQRRFPWLPELFADGGTAPRDVAWPWLAEAGRVAAPEARRILAEGLTVIPETAAGQRVQVLLALARVEGDPVLALAYLDRAEAMDAPRGDLLARRHAVLAAAGRWDEAAVAAWDWARLRPDDTAALDALFVPEVAERIGWARAFAHLHDHVQRDPDDPARRRRALDRHQGPGGAPPLAQAHARALGLGAGAGGPEGTVYHPVTGRLVRVEAEGRWIEAEWSPDGLDLISLADSRGQRVTLRRRMGKLVAIEAGGPVQLQAVLAPDGHPRSLSSPLDDARAAEAYNRMLAAVSLWPKASVAEAAAIRLGGE